MIQNVLRRGAVEQATGLKRSTIYEKIANGTFPKPIRLGDKAVGWLESEISAWQERCVAERDKAR